MSLNMNPNKYFSGHNLKYTESEQNLGMSRNKQFGWEMFTLRRVA